MGTFVFALATGSHLAELIGLSLFACLVAAVAGFRVGARKVAESDESGIPTDGANIWAQPLRREDVDRYLLHYRGVQPDAPHDATMRSLTRDHPTAPAHERAA